MDLPSSHEPSPLTNRASISSFNHSPNENSTFQSSVDLNYPTENKSTPAPLNPSLNSTLTNSAFTNSTLSATSHEANVPENSHQHRDIIQEQEPCISTLPTTSEHVALTSQTHVHLNDKGKSIQRTSEESKESGLSIIPPPQISEQHTLPGIQEQGQQQQQEEEPATLSTFPSCLQDHHQHIDSSGPSTLAQLISLPSTVAIINIPSKDSTGDLSPLPIPSTSTMIQSQETPRPLSSSSSSSSSFSSIPPLLPRLTLGNMPIFTSADEPPPYSPTHTILPHYFSLEPIPVRSFIIKESTTVPYIYDFWLCTTPQSASPGLLFQERGLVQSPNELKYCIIRPQDTDRTAFPASGISAQNAYFTPALALVSANYPSRWIWWGTEALHMVVFGRQLKNIIMEWKWKHARLRIGGPIVHRLVGCSFSITPERKYCWKQGSGRRRPTETLGSRTEASRRNQGGQGQGQGQSSNSSRRSGQNTLTTISEIDNRAIRGGWLGSFFGRSGSNWNSSDTSNNTANNIQLDHIQISVPSTPALESSNTANSTAQPVIQSTEENPTLSEQEASADTLDNIEEDEEAGCYHCREECPSGITGRIVAVYKPGRPANRARDRPASSPKLEIYSELGERCETVMMLMCVRLDDLFMSIPDEKRGPFVPTSSGPNPGQGSTTGGSNRGAGGQNNQNAEGENSGASTVGDDRSEISALKRLLKRHHIWKVWVKWFIAAALISMVVVLVLRSKLSKSAK